MSKGLKINISDDSQLLARLVLNSDIIDEIITSPQWVEDSELIFKFQVNGIEMNPKSLEKLLKLWYESVINQVKEKYDVSSLDRLVEDRAQEMVQDVISNLHDFESYSENLLEKFPTKWERELKSRKSDKPVDSAF